MAALQKVCLICKKEYQEEGLLVCPQDGGQIVPMMKDPLIGKLLADKYEILSVLGSGGMSVIYKARHQYMDRICAVKLLHPFLTSDNSLFQRFQYEAKAASNLSHPNIVGMHDFGITNDGRAYLVMDFLDGEDLGSILERETHLNEEIVREVLRQTLLGLDHAHSKGVIHRDLKPSNLFLMQGQEDSILLKIVDFGIAKMADGPDGAGQNLTRTGEVFGSPLYMSPEQCAGKPLDARSDLYSLGCLTFEALTGRRPIIGNTALETMQKHLAETAPNLSTAAPNLTFSDEMSQAVEALLAKRPDDRFESAAHLYEFLFHETLPRLGSSRPTSTGHNLKPADQLQVTEQDIKSKPKSGLSASSLITKPPQNDSNMSIDMAAMTPNGTVIVQTGSSLAAQPGTKSGDSQKSTIMLTLSGRQKTAIKASFGVITLCVVASFIAFILFWPGPANDSGTILTRWIYTYQLWRGESLVKEQNFAEAEKTLKEAEKTASKFGEKFSRMASVLNVELMLYTNWNKYDEREKIIMRLTDITRQRALASLDRAMTELNRIDKAREQGKGSATTHNELKLDMITAMPAVLSISKQLYALELYEDQETLLRRTIDTYEHFADGGDTKLSKLKTELAYCHWAQDETDQVRPLLESAKDILQEAHRMRPNEVDELDVANAWLRLGQIDRDLNSLAKAGEELDVAYKVLQPYSEKPDFKDARKTRGYRLFIETLNARADYFERKGDAGAALQLKKEIATLKRRIPLEQRRLEGRSAE